MLVVLADDRQRIGKDGDGLEKRDSIVVDDIGFGLFIVPLEERAFVPGCHTRSMYGVYTTCKSNLLDDGRDA